MASATIRWTGTACLIWLGVMAAGYLRLTGVLTEVILILFVLGSTRVALGREPGSDEESGWLRWAHVLLKRKIAHLSDVLNSKDPDGAVLKVVAWGVMLGWLFVLTNFAFGRTWSWVLARGFVEMAMDACVFFPGFFLLRAYFRRHSREIERNRKEEAAEADRLHESWDAMDGTRDEQEGEVGTPIGGLVTFEDPTGFLTMGPRLQMVMSMDEIVRGYRGDFGAWMEDAREDDVADLKTRWKQARSKLFRLRLLAVSCFGVLPFVLGLGVRWSWPFDPIGAAAGWLRFAWSGARVVFGA